MHITIYTYTPKLKAKKEFKLTPSGMRRAYQYYCKCGVFKSFIALCDNNQIIGDITEACYHAHNSVDYANYCINLFKSGPKQKSTNRAMQDNYIAYYNPIIKRVKNETCNTK